MPPTTTTATTRSPRWCTHLDPRSKHGRIYLVLLALRCYSAFFGHGYIHPDEWMQSGEPYFDLTFPSVYAKIPWEWRPDQALRSSSTLRSQYLVVDALVAIVRRFGTLSGRSLFWIQRGNMLLWTLLLDTGVALLLPPQIARYMHYTFGISTAATTFLVRPFSNSHEAHLLAFFLLHVLVLYKDRAWYRRSPLAGWHWGTLLATLSVDGFFTRFTFAIFALPLLLFFAYHHVTIATDGHRRSALFSLSITAIAAIVFLASRIEAETSFYTRSAKAAGMQVAGLWGSGWVVPPINALLYNAKTENVAQHGLHPRWLHAVVNWPMMVGVANCGVVVVYGWRFVRERRYFEVSSRGAEKMEEERQVEQVVGDAASTVATLSTEPGPSSTAAPPPPTTEEATPYIDPEPLAITLCLSIIAFSLLTLSLSPHQEPRFLLALAFPSSLIMAYALSSPTFALRPYLLRTLITLHAVQHILQLVLFSFLHQASLLPALFDIDQSVSRLFLTQNTWFDLYEQHLLYGTFSVPLHLVPRKGAGMLPRVEAFDSSSTAAHVVRQAGIACDHTWVYAPSWIVSVLQHEAHRQGKVELVKVETWSAHVDMDHLGESWDLVKEVGWREAFAVQKLHARCLTGERPQQEQHTSHLPSHRDL